MFFKTQPLPLPQGPTLAWYPWVPIAYAYRCHSKWFNVDLVDTVDYVSANQPSYYLPRHISIHYGRCHVASTWQPPATLEALEWRCPPSRCCHVAPFGTSAPFPYPHPLPKVRPWPGPGPTPLIPGQGLCPSRSGYRGPI